MAEAAVFVDLGLSKRQSKKVPVEAKRPIKVPYPQLHLDQSSSHVTSSVFTTLRQRPGVKALSVDGSMLLRDNAEAARFGG